jgi:hypothetical protein
MLSRPSFVAGLETGSAPSRSSRAVAAYEKAQAPSPARGRACESAARRSRCSAARSTRPRPGDAARVTNSILPLMRKRLLIVAGVRQKSSSEAASTYSSTGTLFIGPRRPHDRSPRRPGRPRLRHPNHRSCSAIVERFPRHGPVPSITTLTT